MNRESERQRLIDLLYTYPNMSLVELDESELADHLLDSGIVVPPCKVGDEVFYVHEIYDENGDEYLDINIGEVASFSLQAEGLWVYCRYKDGLTYWHLVEEFGLELFLTREEAEKMLKGEGEK